MNKTNRLFRVIVVLALLLGSLGSVAASGMLFHAKLNSNLTQMAGQSLQPLAPAGLVEQAVSWNSGVFGTPAELAVSWNSGVFGLPAELAVSWNSGVTGSAYWAM